MSCCPPTPVTRKCPPPPCQPVISQGSSVGTLCFYQPPCPPPCEEKISCFIRNNSNTKPTLRKYKVAINNFLKYKNVIQKSGLLRYSDIDKAFIIYMDDLSLGINLSVTLASSSDLTNGENVEPIEQPTFNYNNNNGILYIYPKDEIYKTYENYFILTCDIKGFNISLYYNLIYSNQSD